MDHSEKQPKILVVEDDVDIRLVLCAFLRHSGFEVCAALDGREAISTIPQFCPDLIVLDLMMRPVSGWEVLRWLEATRLQTGDASSPGIPVLVVTARTPLAEQMHGFEAGAVEYVTKPTQPSIIVEHIRAILSLTTEQRTLLRHQRIDEYRRILARIHGPHPNKVLY